MTTLVETGAREGAPSPSDSIPENMALDPSKTVQKTWPLLRVDGSTRLTCGHVGCCDSSPHRHTRKHFRESKHPIIQSFEPGEDWRWCYVHEAEV